MEISEFPSFSKINIDSIDEYKKLVQHYPPISDISFATLFIWWNALDTPIVSRLNGNLIYRYQEKPEANIGLALLGDSKINESVLELIKFSKANDSYENILIHVPEYTINMLSPDDNLIVQKENDYREYILSTKKIAELNGSEMGRFRRKISRFEKTVKDKVTEFCELKQNENQWNSLLKASKKWHKTSSSNNDRGFNEYDALSRTLFLCKKLQVSILGLSINQSIEGFVAYHLSADNKTAIVNHIKVNYEYSNIYDAITQRLSRYLYEKDIETINFEMDLGIEGLRTYKQRLRPIQYLNKYSIQVK